MERCGQANCFVSKSILADLNVSVESQRNWQAWISWFALGVALRAWRACDARCCLDSAAAVRRAPAWQGKALAAAQSPGPGNTARCEARDDRSSPLSVSPLAHSRCWAFCRHCLSSRSQAAHGRHIWASRSRVSLAWVCFIIAVKV